MDKIKYPVYYEERYEYNDKGDAIYHGISHVGAKDYEPKWLIFKYIYDDAGNLLSKEAIGHKYDFSLVWNLRSIYNFPEDEEVTKNSPIINNISFSNDYLEENGTYTLTFDVTDPNGLPLYYNVTSDNPDLVTITQDPDNPNVFTISVGEVTEDTPVTITATVTNSDGFYAQSTSTVVIHSSIQPPSINSITWDTTDQYENESYTLTIDAVDPNGLDMTYKVTSDNPDLVTITQDSSNPNIFTISYGEVTENTTVNFTISVSNSDGLTTQSNISTTVQNVPKNPIINDIVWSDDYQEENKNYLLTINASDPLSLPLTYNVSSDNSSLVTITQDSNNPNIFTISYGEVTEDTTVNFTITVTNSDGLSASESISTVVHNVIKPPIINSIIWSDTNQEENNDYTLTINATDPQGLPLVYNVSSDNDTLVTITQDSNNPNIFNISYGEVDTDTTVNFTIIVTNSEGLSNQIISSIIVHNTTITNGDRGVFGGGLESLYYNTIDYITISILGDALDFGDLTIARWELAATSNGTNNRGIFGGGYDGNTYSIIEYITIDSLGNSLNYGNLSNIRRCLAAVSNTTNDRGVFGGGLNDTTFYNIIDYITITILGNTINFGELIIARSSISGTSNGTNDRGVFSGGYNGTTTYNTIDYITINILSNASDFGDLISNRRFLSSTSNTTNERGVFSGGDNFTIIYNIIDYITINILGNALDFGNLTVTRSSISGTSNGTNDRGVFGGGDDGTTNYNTIDYITISVLGNASDFGDLTVIRRGLTATSNSI